MALSPAKINLYLQVCGKRADGYHLIDSLMAPLAFGDALEVDAAPNLEIVGSDIPQEQNLVMKAACALQAALNTKQGAHITLTKHIPQAAGLGGGSSNAATTLKLLLSLWNQKLDHQTLITLATSLGADVPFFINATSRYAEGIGEKLTPVQLPKLHILLTNPNVPVPTASVFAKGFAHYSKPAPKREHFADVAELIAYLKPLTNDLTANALAIAPQIAQTLTQIEKSKGCLLARMSGSGATCFGIFDSTENCALAAKTMPSGIWAKATTSL